MRTARVGTAVAATAVALLALPPSTVLAQQAQAAKPSPAAKPPVASGQAAASSRRPGGVPQGFSVILVLGDIQGGTTSDDVPPAARKALNDMREFLPFKSFRLLDAAWVLCCGGQWESERRGAVERSRATQVLRGPDDQEYNLMLASSRDAGRVSVQFTLTGASVPVEAVSSTAAIRTMQRKIADLRDRRAVLETTIARTRQNVEIGAASPHDLPKMEAELRSIDREIEDMAARVAEANAATNTTTARGGARASQERPRPAPSAIIDTSFTMDVGETVVVGTSRQKGGSKALIALLTAVPPRPAARE
jgi:hypothetical protein